MDQDLFLILAYSIEFLLPFERFCVLACSKHLTSKIAGSNSDAGSMLLTEPAGWGSWPAKAPWIHALEVAAAKGATTHFEVDCRALHAREYLDRVLRALPRPTPPHVGVLSLANGRIDPRLWGALGLLHTVDSVVLDNMSVSLGSIQGGYSAHFPLGRRLLAAASCAPSHAPSYAPAQQGAAAEDGVVLGSTAKMLQAAFPMWGFAASVRRLTCRSCPWLTQPVRASTQSGHASSPSTSTAAAADAEVAGAQTCSTVHLPARAGAGAPAAGPLTCLSFFKGLQHADLSGATHETLMALVHAPQLTSLVLRDTRMCPLRGTDTAHSSVFSRLESLELHRCFIQPRRITEQPGHGVITEILCLATHLRHLEINKCRDASSQLTGANLQTWAGVLAELAGGHSIPSAYRAVLYSYSHLHYAEHVDQVSEVPPGPQLRSLHLIGIVHLRGEHLQAVASAVGGSLQSLALATERRGPGWEDRLAPSLRRQLLNGPTAASWASFFKACPGLQQLRVCDLPGLRDAAVLGLTEACPQLQQVHISAAGVGSENNSEFLPVHANVHSHERPAFGSGAAEAHPSTSTCAASTSEAIAQYWQSIAEEAICAAHVDHGALGASSAEELDSAECGSALPSHTMCPFGCAMLVSLAAGQNSNTSVSAGGIPLVEESSGGAMTLNGRTMAIQCLLDHAAWCTHAPLPCANRPVARSLGADAYAADLDPSEQTTGPIVGLVGACPVQPAQNSNAAAIVRIHSRAQHARETACRKWIPRHAWAEHCCIDCTHALAVCPFARCKITLHARDWERHTRAHVSQAEAAAIAHGAQAEAQQLDSEANDVIHLQNHPSFGALLRSIPPKASRLRSAATASGKFSGRWYQRPSAASNRPLLLRMSEDYA